MRSIFLTIIVMFVGSYGCKEDGPKPVQAQESIYPTLAVEKTPVEQPTVSKQPVDDKPTIVVPPPTEPVPPVEKNEVKTAEAAATAPKVPEKKPLPPLDPLPELTDKQAQRVCMRSCNKAHQCDFARGSVALCVTRCIVSQKNTTDRKTYQEALWFRAQSECADKACAYFEPCVVKEVKGAKALANAPPMARDKTEAFCKALCGKEKACKPTHFSNIPGGMVTCVANCQQVAIRPDKTAAAKRVFMNAAFKCVAEECGKPFEDCAQENMTRRDNSKSAGHTR